MARVAQSKVRAASSGDHGGTKRKAGVTKGMPGGHQSEARVAPKGSQGS